MPHPKNKKQRIITAGDDVSLTEASAGDDGLSTELLANIFGFLDGPQDIMQKRGVCKKWREAAKITIVPVTDFRVCSVEKYNAVNVMARAMPNLQQIKLCAFGREDDDSESDEDDLDIDDDQRLRITVKYCSPSRRYHHKWNDGEDPNEERAARTAGFSSHDIEIISNFSKLQILEINGGLNGRYPFWDTVNCGFLNGRYPVLFSFPLLQKLSIKYCNDLKWDLEMLTGFPLLKELECEHNQRLAGNINSLGVLKDTLEKVKIFSCDNVEGNFMDLADFPHLEELNLLYTEVKGDIRDIGENDFSSLECLALPNGVYGGVGYELQLISDAPDLVRAVYLLKKQHPALKMDKDWYAVLSDGSPDSYVSVDEDVHIPPFFVRFVEAGSRVGYRWENPEDTPCACEVNWLDPEPDRESSDYEEYVEELQKIEEQVTMYRGFHEPPTEEEYLRLEQVTMYEPPTEEELWGE
jgi:hypothetical protein